MEEQQKNCENKRERLVDKDIQSNTMKLLTKDMLKKRFKQTEIGMIPEDWEVRPVEYFCKSITSGGTPSRSNNKYWDNGDIIWLKTKELFDSNIYDSEEKITELGLKNSSAKLFPRGTIIFALYAAPTLGRMGILKVEATTNQACAGLEVDEKKADTLFLFYELKNFRSRLQNLGCGAAQQNINQQILKKFKLPYTKNLEEQKAIAKILSDLDAKIELNHEMNKTLEAMGQALFKHWFVDFEFPNEKGKPYKSSGGEMVESELGEIPEGWEVIKMGKKLKVVLGGTPDRTKKEYWRGDINWINSGKINEFRIIEPSEKITKEGLEKSATRLLPKGTVVLAITGATLGQVSKLEIDSCANQSVIGILENKDLASEYLYFWVKKTITDIIGWQTGGAQQHINKGNVENSNILLPNKEILEKYLKIVKPIFNQISINCFESNDLSRTRDSLLPKLMSGKIRVPVND